jgi:hypothetical protein
VPTVWNTKGDIVAESSDIDPGIPASFKLSTPGTDEKTVLNKLSVPRIKLVRVKWMKPKGNADSNIQKPHAPEFIPRTQLYDNNISIVATLSDVTNVSHAQPLR